MGSKATAITGADLRYPLYLDVPMMISFLAALQDGIAYDKTVNSKSAQARAQAGEVGASVRLPALTQLLPFNLQGKLQRETKQDESEEEQVVRRHTEASFFNILYKALMLDGSISDLDLASKEEWQSLHCGELVSVTGEIFRNPLDQAVHFNAKVPGLKQLIHPPNHRDEDPSQQPRQPSRQKRSTNASRPEPQDDMAKAFQTLGEELRAATLQDLLFRPTVEPTSRIVLTLKQEYGTEHSLEDVLEAETVVLGKVTKAIRQHEKINLLRRTSVRYLPEYNEVLETYLADLQFANIEGEKTIVEGPGIQIRPLAIFS